MSAARGETEPRPETLIANTGFVVSVMERGREITLWDSSVWKRRGDLELDGRRFQVRGNTRGSKVHHGG
jgi:hypothetical protein